MSDINPNTTFLSIPNGCNNINFKTFDISSFLNLEQLVIGDNCYRNVNEFLINGLNHLKSLKIGINSFTIYRNEYGNISSRSFSILNCNELQSIEIGSFSFSDYGCGFEVRNLPNLNSIELGTGAFSGSLSTIISSILMIIWIR